MTSFEEQRLGIIERFAKIFSTPRNSITKAKIVDAPGSTVQAIPMGGEEARKLAQHLESNIYQTYEQSAEMVKQYNAKVRQLLFNLQHNPYLWFRVREGELSMEELVEMPADDMSRKSATEEPRSTTMDVEVQVSRPQGIKTSMYHCPSCGGNDILESPMPDGGGALLGCEQCGRKWKLGGDP